LEADDGIPCIIYAAKSTEDRRGSIPDQLRDCRTAAAPAGDRAPPLALSRQSSVGVLSTATPTNDNPDRALDTGSLHIGILQTARGQRSLRA
jgi:hypothetical protein